jgi:hypothetical protein
LNKDGPDSPDMFEFFKCLKKGMIFPIQHDNRDTARENGQVKMQTYNFCCFLRRTSNGPAKSTPETSKGY